MEIIKKEDKKNKHLENLEEIKKQYTEIAQKFSLPNFEELRENFDIDKFLEKDSDYLIRDIRRGISEKISAYLHLFETFVNPASPPVFVFSFLKSLTLEQRTNIKEIYKDLAKIQLFAMKLDTIYNLKSETEFVNNTAEKWKILQKKILSLIEIFEKEFEKNVESNEKSYFG